MKRLLIISIVLNLGLAGSLIFLWADKREIASESNSLALSVTRPMATEVPICVPEAAPRPEPQPFRWSQLEANDYHVYVKNLRDIGCPELALRAIVTADVDTLYRQRSSELEKKLDDLNNSSWAVQLSSYRDEQALKAEMQQLPGEEYAEICDLLSLKPAPVQVAAASPGLQKGPSQERSVKLPLVMQNINLEALKLNEQQVQVIDGLRQKFLLEVGGANQDPNDSAYLARCRQAQPEIDQTLRGLLGSRFYIRLQVLAANQTSPPQ